MKKLSHDRNSNLHSLDMYERLKRLALYAALAAVLALAFIGYLRPAFIFDLANRIVMCL